MKILFPANILAWAAMVLVSIIAASSLPVPAYATLDFCNYTDAPRYVAVGYKNDGEWVSKGWWKIENGDCTSVIPGDLQTEQYYYRATDAENNFAGQSYTFCTTAAAFNIVGDTDCEARGYRTDNFSLIDTGAKTLDYTFNLVPENAGSDGKTSAPTQQKTGDRIIVTGIFQGCDYLDAVTICTVQANNWFYVVHSNAQTDKALTKTLAKLDMGRKVTISGTEVAYGDISTELVLSAVRPENGYIETTPPKSVAQNMDAIATGLVGDWSSLDGIGDGLKITNTGGWQAIAQDTIVARSTFTLTNSCSSGADSEDIYVRISRQNAAETDCYMLSRPNKNSLNLTDMARGNILHYQRIKQ